MTLETIVQMVELQDEGGLLNILQADWLASTLVVLVTEMLGYICYPPGDSDGKESACSAGEPD